MGPTIKRKRMSQAQQARQQASDIGRYRAQLLRFARLRLHNPAHAEDAVQDALVAAIEGMKGFCGDAAMGSWLTGILKHKIVDCVRRSARDHVESLDAHVLLSDALNPEEEMSRRDLLERLDRGLAELSRQAAQVILLRDVLGLTTAEACGELGISTTNCGVLLHRARRRLRERLSADGIGAAA